MRRARERLAAFGLRGRLAAWVAAVVLVCTGITFFAVYRGTGAQLRRQIDRELTGDAVGLSHSLRLSRSRSPTRIAQTAASYIGAQPFKPSSTLLFATVPGVGTSSNRAELFSAQQPDHDESPAAQASENRLSAELLSARDGYTTLTVADLGDLRLLKRTVIVNRGPRVTVGVAEPLEPVAHAQASVAGAFVLAGVLALAGALLAAYLIGTRISRPLRRMAVVAARVDGGDLRPRIGDADAGAGKEVHVLAEAFDHMLDRLTEAFAAQRAFVADASHELRTPLTVIAGQLEVLAAQSQPSAIEVRRVERQVRSEIARITRLVDDLLLLARSEHGQFLRSEPIDLARFVTELWDGAIMLGDRRFELGSVPEGTLVADPDRLAQALRNLIANAIQHTAPERGLVRLRVESARGGLRFVVEDDGPGIPEDERERVFQRFNRLDAARDRASGGTGLGLAIVRAIAAAQGGSVSAGESSYGGARIELWLAHFVPAPALAEDDGPGVPSAQDAGVADRVAAGLGPDA